MHTRHGVHHSFTILSTIGTASQANNNLDTMCHIRWEDSSSCEPSSDKTALDASYSSSNGVAFTVYRNGHVLGLEMVEVKEATLRR